MRQDEIMILLELNDDMTGLPNEVFLHLNEIYCKADKSAAVIKEYGHSQASSNNFLGAFGGKVANFPYFSILLMNFFRLFVYKTNISMSTVTNPPRVALLDRIVSTQMGGALDEVNFYF